MHWMEFILVVYYLLYPVWTVVAGTGSSGGIFLLFPETGIHPRSMTGVTGSGTTRATFMGLWSGIRISTVNGVFWGSGE